MQERSEAKRSDVPYGHASKLLLDEGSKATEPYNKHDKIRPHSIRSLQFDQKVRPMSFRPKKFDLFTATCARASTTMSSHTSCLPISQGIMATPSGRLSWVRYSQRGSSIEGKSRDPNVCFMRELRVAWPEKRPALLAQERPCKPSRSTLLPQGRLFTTTKVGSER